MTNGEKEAFSYGVIVCFMVTVFIIALAYTINIKFHPEEGYKPNALLNSPTEWTIDTTYMITGKDTSVTYKFRKLQYESTR